MPANTFLLRILGQESTLGESSHELAYLGDLLEVPRSESESEADGLSDHAPSTHSDLLFEPLELLLVGSSHPPPPHQEPNAYASLPASMLASRRTAAEPVLPTHAPPPMHQQIHHLSERDRAMWLWANLENMDVFLRDVYQYYTALGFYPLMLQKVIELATLVFVVGLAVYISLCIDWDALTHAQRLADATYPSCAARLSAWKRLVLFATAVYVCLKTARLHHLRKKATELHRFYNHLLDISDDELPTILWPAIVERIIEATATNGFVRGQPQPLTALEIANRIMRRDNFLIGMFSNGVLDTSLPLPTVLTARVPFLALLATRGVSGLTRTLEWNLTLCVSQFVFSDSGQVHRRFLSDRNRALLAAQLRQRFVLAGCVNLVLAPLIATYFLLLIFLRYFNQYKMDPGNVFLARQYTPTARWELREYNELSHFFTMRLKKSIPVADEYLAQFPSVKTAQMARFVSFIVGSLVGVLAVLTLIDSERFLTLEITKDRNVLFYVTVLGSVWAMTRAIVPDERLVYDPEGLCRRLGELTHYQPQRWEGRMHTVEVRNEFTLRFYDLKVAVLVKELASLVTTPFVLWWRLAPCSEQIVDFVREYTIHVDGLGYVCYFAMFDFRKRGAAKVARKESRDEAPVEGSGTATAATTAAATARPTRKDLLRVAQTRAPPANDKMMQSFIHFGDTYGEGKVPRTRPARTTNTSDSLLDGSYQLNVANHPGMESIGGSGVLTMLKDFYRH